MVVASSSSVEGLATLILSGKYTAYLPDHYARLWAQQDLMRPVLPEVIGYTSLYELITKKEKRKNKLIENFVLHLEKYSTDTSSESFSIGTMI